MPYGYLDPSVDPSVLGFLVIALSGSRVYDPSSAVASDWDGIGIVRERRQIFDLVNEHRSQLSQLLYIEQDPEECQSHWSAVAYQSDWDVLRFSGLDRKGIKRTIKIWSLEGLLATVSSSEFCRIGVLSNRCLYCFHSAEVNALFLYHPVQVHQNLYILEDADFCPPSPGSRIPPGVTCDLLLTALQVFTTSANLLDSIKRLILTKWLKLSGSHGSSIDLLYASRKFTQSYRITLKGDLRRAVVSKDSFIVENMLLCSAKSLTFSFISGNSDTLHRSVCFIGKPHCNGIPPVPVLHDPALSSSSHLLIKERQGATICSPFSSNSSSYYSRLAQANGGVTEWKEVIVKSGPGVTREASVYPLLRNHFPASFLQNYLCDNSERGFVVFDRFPGLLMTELRVQIKNGNLSKPFQTEHAALALLANIELFRTQQVVQVQLNTLSALGSVSNLPDSSIHLFYHSRLLNNCRFRQFYSPPPSFMQTQEDRPLTLEQFMSLPMSINGVTYPSLEVHFRDAESTLDPSGRHLQETPSALGLGDGHGGNVMVSIDGPVALRLIDYEVAGYHNLILDLAKPLYMDGFFPILYGDVLDSDSKGHNGNDTETKVEWCITDYSLTIDFAINFGLVDHVLANIKLNSAVQPILDRLARQFPSKSNTVEQLLSAALFSNAFLTRSFSKSPTTFFLNCAVGVLLMNGLKASLKTFFGWDEWPSTVVASNALTQVLPGRRGQRPWMPIDLDNLVPPMVFLKRFAETLKVHQRFSQDQTGGSDAVIKRIEMARAVGMKIAPHTCIRESMFAEPRIDQHFLYNTILDQAKLSPRATLIDVGCCMGSDIRKLILDGFAAQASEFWSVAS